jgi:hypothetical protein
MNDEENQYAARDLRRATWCCMREWFCFSLGLGLPQLLLLSLPATLGGDFKDVCLLVGIGAGIVGILFALPASWFAFLGILFPGQAGRLPAFKVFVASAGPLWLVHWLLMHSPIIAAPN